MILHKSALLTLLLLVLVASCGGCDAQLAKKKQLLADLQTCNASYSDAVSQTKIRVEIVSAYGCWTDPEKQVASDLVTSIQDQLTAFTTNYPKSKLEGQRDDIVKAANDAEAEFRTIANDWQKLQDAIAMCRARHIFDGASAGAVDDRLFLVAMGDVFAKDHELEGNDPLLNLQHRTRVLKIIRDRLKGHVFIADEKQSRPSELNLDVIPKGKMPFPDPSEPLLDKLLKQSESAVTLTSDFTGSLGKFATELATMVDALESGDSLFWAGGWEKHAIFYQVTRESKGYSFRVFNSGQGINVYHASSLAGEQTHYFPFVEVVHNSRDSVTSLVFLKALQEIRALKPDSNVAPQNIYEKILAMLDGDNQKIPYGADMFRHPQQSGSCSYFATPWIMSSSISDSPFIPNQIESLIRLKTLKDYAASLRVSKDTDPARLNILKKGLNFFAHQSVRQSDEHLVDTGFLAVMADVTHDISNEILSAESARAANFEEKLPKFDPLDLRTTSLSPPSAYPSAASKIETNSQNLNTASVSDFSVDNWIPGPAHNLLSELTSFYSQLRKLVDDGSYMLALVSMETISRRLPLDEAYWQGTTEAQAYNLISKFRELDELLLYTILKRRGEKVRAGEWLVSVKFLTVADLLNQKFTKAGMPSMLQSSIKTYLDGDTAVFETEDAAWQLQIKDMRMYYEGVKAPDLFDYDNYPAGSGDKRRIYDDLSALSYLKDQEAHWSKDRTWRDLNWVKDWMTTQPNYGSWLQSKLNPGLFDFDPLESWIFVTQAPHGPMSSDECMVNSVTRLFQWFCLPVFYPPERRAVPPSQRAQYALHRAATTILSQGSYEGFSLPDSFSQLQILSFITDYLLTGKLEVQVGGVDNGVTLTHSSWRTPFRDIDNSKPYVCSGFVGTWSSVPIATFVPVVESMMFGWERGRQTPWYGWIPACTGVPKYVSQRPGLVVRMTSFGYADLGIQLFGYDIPLEAEQKESAMPKSERPYVHLRKGTIPFERERQFENKVKAERANQFFFDINRLFGIGLDANLELEKPDVIPLRIRPEPNLLPLKTVAEERLPGMSLEQMRRLFGVSGLRNLQISQLIEHFSNFPADLSKRPYQIYFEKLMMEPTLILDQLMISDHESVVFLNMLNRFYRERYVLSIKHGKYGEAAFILHMNQLLANAVAEAKTYPGVKLGVKLPVLLDTANEIFKLTLSEDEKAFFYRQLIWSYVERHELTVDDIKHLLLAEVLSRVYGAPTEKYVDSRVEDEIRDVLIVQAARIRAALATNQNDILNYVVSKARPDVVSVGKWTQDYWKPALFKGVYEKQESPFYMDVSTGRLSQSGRVQMKFPIPIHELHEALGANILRPDDAIEIDADAYQWTDSTLGTVWAKRQAGVWQFQADMGGERYQWMPTSEVELLKDSKIYFPDMVYWKSVELKDDKQYLWVLDRDSRKLIYQIDIERKYAGWWNSVQVTRWKDMAQLLDAKASTSYGELFSRIEDAKHVYVWADMAGKPIEVELPRWNHLVFKIKDGQLSCGNQVNYVVSQNQYSLELGAPATYLMCESPTKNRIALMPFTAYSKTELKKRLSAEMKSKFDLFLGYGVYADRIPDGAPRLFLAYRYLMQQRYSESADELSRNLTRFEALTKTERAILDLMAKGNGEDEDPRAYALRVRAASEILRDREEFQIAEKGRFEFTGDDTVMMLRVGDLYGDYLPKLEHVGRNILGVRDEIRLARWVARWPGISELVTNRLKALEAELKGEEFGAQINAVSPSDPAFERAPSMLSRDKIVVFYELKEGFESGTGMHIPSGTVEVLNPVSLMTASNLGFLYRVAAGETFNEDAARAALNSILGSGVADQLNAAQLRLEINSLVELAALQVKGEKSDDNRGRARWIESIITAKKNGTKIETFDAVKARFAEIKRGQQQAVDLQASIDKADRDERQLKQNQNDVECPKCAHFNKWCYPGTGCRRCSDGYQRCEPEMAIYHREMLRIERLLVDIADKMGAYEKEMKEVVEKYKQEQTAVVNMFRVIQDKDMQPYKLVEQQFESGPAKVTKPIKGYVKPSSQEVQNSLSALADVASHDPLQAPVFGDDVFAKIILMTTESPAGLMREVQSLDAVLARTGNLPVIVKNALGNLRRDIVQQGEWLKSRQAHIQVVDWKLFDKRREALSRIIEELKTKLMTLKTEAIVLGTKEAHALEGGAYQKLMGHGGVARSPTFDDILYMLLKRKHVEIYTATGGALSAAELVLLEQKLMTYMMLSTYVQHLKSVVSAMQAVKNMDSSLRWNDTESQQLLADLVSLGKETRRYKIDDATRPTAEYLLFEYFQEVLLRQSQIVALDQLQIKDGVIHNEAALGTVLEMIMGAGKTSVLLPLLSTLSASDEQLNVVMLPEALVTSMAVELKTRMNSAFGRGISILRASRQRRLGPRDLELMYDNLVQARLENRTVVTTNSAVQSLFLSFIDTLYGYQTRRDQSLPEVAAYQNIFKYLRQYARLTIDEVDLALDILQAHQFSTGEKISLMDDKSGVLETIPVTVISLYRLLATDDGLKKAIGLPFLLSSNHQNPITEASYTQFKTKLVDAILDPNRHFFAGFKDWQRTFEPFIQSSSVNMARRYLLAGTVEDRQALFSKIDDRLKDIFAILYDELNTVFEITASKKLFVHYGPLPKGASSSTRYIAVPYHSGEPMVNSRFGTPVEALNYAIQMALQSGDYEGMVASEIEVLRKMAKRPLIGLRAAEFNERLAALSDTGEVLHIHGMDDGDIRALAERIAKPDRIMTQLSLITRQVLPQITVYPMQLQTNAQVYEALFKIVQGFSGTLWSADTFPEIFGDPIMSDTTQRTLLTLWRDARVNGLQLKSVEPGNLPSFVAEIYRDWTKPGSLMDEAGLLRTYANVDVAREMLKHAKGMSVIFYDEHDHMMVLDRNGAIAPIEEPQIRHADRIAFWDKKHTTGSDIKLRPDMQAKMIIDRHISSRALQQTVWRLRGLGKGQQVVQYLATPNDLRVIGERLSKEWGIVVQPPLTLGDLILYSVVNQEVRLGDLRFRALKQKMKNILVKQALSDMFSDVNAAAIVRIYGPVRSLFELKLDNQSLHHSMGIPRAELDIDLALAHEETRLMQAPGYYRARATIKTLVAKERPKLPAKVRVSTMDTDSEVEVEKEQEQERENEEDLEQIWEVETPPPAPTGLKPHAVLNWSLENVFIAPLKIGVQPLEGLSTALASKGQGALANLVDPNILISLNFAPLHYRPGWYETRQHLEFQFFDAYQKYADNVLVVQDKHNGHIQLVVVDGNDLLQWDEFLKNDAARGVIEAGRTVKIGLYGLASGRIYRNGAEPIDEAVLKSNPHFVKMIVQVKFFGGYVNYPEDTNLHDLKQFISHDPKGLLKLYRVEIVRYRHQTRQEFDGSDLQAAFKDILGEDVH